MSETLFTLYERLLPASLRAALAPWVSSPATLRWFVLYAFIGMLGVAVYLSLALILTNAGVPSLIATVAGMIAGMSLQFALNRNINFRAFGDAVHRQASIYVVIFLCNMVLTVGIVWLAMKHLGANVLVANCLSIPVTFPIAYLANRHLTFGRGIDQHR